MVNKIIAIKIYKGADDTEKIHFGSNGSIDSAHSFLVAGTQVLGAQKLKANYNNWATLGDLLNALADHGTIDAA